MAEITIDIQQLSESDTVDGACEIASIIQLALDDAKITNTCRNKSWFAGGGGHVCFTITAHIEESKE